MDPTEQDTGMTTLAEFLLARIAEDEIEAHIASDIPWIWSGDSKSGGAAHYVTHMGPARLKVECEAKRKIVWIAQIDGPSDRLGIAHDSLRALARVYADHPDYRQEWKP